MHRAPGQAPVTDEGNVRVLRPALPLIAVGTLLLLVLWLAPTRQHTAGESVVLHDMGVAKDGRPLSHEFVVTNDTESTWNLLRISKSCGCASASAASEEVLPGKKLRVTVGIDPRGKSGVFRVDAHCVFDGRGPLHLELKVDVQPYLRAVPSRLDFGHVVAGRRPTCRVRVDLQDGATIDSVSVSHPNALVAGLSRRLGQQYVDVSVRASKIGRLPRRLSVSVHSIRGRINIPVVGEVVRPVGLVPGAVVLAEGETPLPAYVWLRAFDPDLDQVESVDVLSAPGLVCREQGLPGGGVLGRLYAITRDECEEDAECVFRVRVGREVTVLRLPVFVTN